MHTFDDLTHIIEELRSDHGCPWDKKQTHESLKVCLEEETQEVLDAIDNKDLDNLCEELGDLLLQVMLHSQIAAESGEFTIHHVVDGICEKMIRRHPHVFGDLRVDTPEEGRDLWNRIKREEKAEKLRKRGKKP